MSFKEVPTKVDFPALERQILDFWEKSEAFRKQTEVHQSDPHWSFIDGPITANNPMGVHHGWGRTYKDLYNRFWTMRGRKLRYQNGFDCQGLWVEVEVEKSKGFTSKKDIEDFGLENFVRLCKARVLRYAAIQTEQSIRLGYWMDWNSPETLRRLADLIETDPQSIITVDGPEGPYTNTVEQVIGHLGLQELGGSYFTFSNENNYMIWSFLKKCWQKGWLYRGVDVMPWCPRCATGISQHEIVTDGYAELTHRSVTMRFPLRDRLGEALLVWTTTPWTLTSNVAAAVGPNLTYAKVRQRDQVLYLSKGTLHMLRGSYEVLAELKGFEMEGWTYDGPFDELPAENEVGGHTVLKELSRDVHSSAVQAHQVILWDEVGETEGTGIVHIAPGCGAEDFQLGKEHHFPLVAPLDEEGHFVQGFDWLTGKHVSEVAELIFADLEQKGRLYHVEPYTHRYPTCWRCKTELVFRLVDEWFISMGEVYDKPRELLTKEEKERSLRYQIMDVVEQIRWIPEFGFAREMDWLHNMHDWMISKKRYWGLALPFWICESCSHHEVIGDEKELQERAVEGWQTFEGHTPHRPFIDAIKLSCPKCGGRMNRIPDVGNPWLDAGIVPFSTLRYRTDPDYWRSWYPAHWISESFPGQFRNWFYSLLAMATVVDQSPPFLQNFGYGTLLAEDGRPMHKSWGNMIEFNEAADKMGVDVMRWLFSAHKPENDLLFGYSRGDEARRSFLIPLWNSYSFLATYGNLDKWTPDQNREKGPAAHPETGFADFDPKYPEGKTPSSQNLLDRWIVGRLNQIIQPITEALEGSDSLTAALDLSAFLDDLSNWYIRRSRRRFWKSEHDQDKQEAYATLYHVIVKFTRLLAPFIPFVTEEIYQNLVRSAYPTAFESVHHTAWPVVDPDAIDAELIDQMEVARQVASLGLAARNSAGLKVRQPLSRALAYAGGRETLRQELVDIIIDELNVKRFEFVQQASQLITYKVMPDNKLLGPRFGSRFPMAREELQKLDPSSIVEKIAAGLGIQIHLDGEPVEIGPQEIIVQTEPAAGLAVASDRLVTVAVDSQITPQLRSEGLAREVVRRIQAMRKDAGFEISDRISTYYQASEDFSTAIKQWAEYIQTETLTNNLQDSLPPENAFSETQTVDGLQITLGVEKIQ